MRENVLGVFVRANAMDPENATLTYAFGGPDAARFTFNPPTRELRFAAQPDFEAPADANGNNVYDVFFTVSDGVNSVMQNLAVTVANVAPGFRVRRLAAGLAAPIFLAGLPDGSGRVAVVERAGRIRIFNPATGAFEAANLLDLTGQVDTTGEKGLLSIAFSPNFAADRAFYLHLNPTTANVTEIRRYTVQAANPAIAESGSGDAILTIQQPSATNHKGGTLVFDPQGRLLISLGDGGNTPNDSQLTSSLIGKILRIDPATDGFPSDASRDYAIPPQNPFASGGGLPEIYAMGLRNPFRMSVDPVTGDSFIGDVGQGTLEEVDRIPASQSTIINFGWPLREGSGPSMAAPIRQPSPCRLPNTAARWASPLPEAWSIADRSRTCRRSICSPTSSRETSGRPPLRACPSAACSPPPASPSAIRTSLPMSEQSAPSSVSEPTWRAMSTSSTSGARFSDWSPCPSCRASGRRLRRGVLPSGRLRSCAPGGCG